MCECVFVCVSVCDGDGAGAVWGSRDSKQEDLRKIGRDTVGDVGNKLWVSVDDDAALVVPEAPHNACKAAAHQQHPAHVIHDVSDTGKSSARPLRKVLGGQSRCNSKTPCVQVC